MTYPRSLVEDIFKMTLKRLGVRNIEVSEIHRNCVNFTKATKFVSSNVTLT